MDDPLGRSTAISVGFMVQQSQTNHSHAVIWPSIKNPYRNKILISEKLSLELVREILEIWVLSSEDKWDKIYEINENLQCAPHLLTMVKKEGSV